MDPDPCPKCGRKIITTLIGCDGWTRVMCAVCGASVYKPSRREAVWSWNEGRPNSRTKRAAAYAKGTA